MRSGMSLQSIRAQNNNADSRQSKLQLSSYPNKLNAENSKNWRDDAKGKPSKDYLFLTA